MTDLDVELIEHKSGRFIADIQFRVGKKQQEALPLRHPPVPVDLSQVVRATAAGIRSEDAEALIQTYGNEAMTAGLDAVVNPVFVPVFHFIISHVFPCICPCF